ncbi:protein transport protein SEC31 homolog B-like [Rhododendron vialii]|uniref:protein transport protein SEC31 homolog B-like n=1 Tax=Rhododendron vialii TaxID=182163 RepID=UPI00265FDB09|nr:protein transport protein SEC31 homolog B-like [Rhododendron vialii]
MSQVLAPTPASRGFMPVTSARVQRPGMGPTQSSSPTQPAQVQSAITPASTPPTVQAVDTSNVPAQQRPVIMTLTRFLNETSEALGGSCANPAKKREIEDNSRKIGALFSKLDISKNASEKLVQLCQSLDNGYFGTALQIQGELKYDLYAVVVHTELSSTCGHYYCFVHCAQEVWYKFDDSKGWRRFCAVSGSLHSILREARKQGTPCFSSFLETEKSYVDQYNPTIHPSQFWIARIASVHHPPM